MTTDDQDSLVQLWSKKTDSLSAGRKVARWPVLGQRPIEKLLGATFALCVLYLVSPYVFTLIIVLNIVFSPALYYLIKHDRPPLLDSNSRVAQVVYYVLVTWFYILVIAILAFIIMLIVAGLLEFLGIKSPWKSRF